MACHDFLKKGLFLTDIVIFEKSVLSISAKFYEVVNCEKQYEL